MSDPGQNPGSPAEGSAPSALDDGGLSEFFSPEPSASPAPAAEGAPAQPAPAAAPAAQPQQPAPAAPAAPAPAPAPVPAAQPTVSPEDVQALRAEIAKLNGPKPGEEPPAPADPFRAVPDYDMQIPVQLIQQLNDPDDAVRAKALSATISAVAKTVHHQVLNQTHAILDQLRSEIPQMAQRTVADRQEGERANQDFYGKYPQYNTDVLRPLVQMAVLHVGKANPQLAEKGWTPEFRDAVGTYLTQNVPLVAQAAPPAPAPAKVPGAAPPAIMGSGARPQAPVLDGNAQALAEMFPA